MNEPYTEEELAALVEAVGAFIAEGREQEFREGLIAWNEAGKRFAPQELQDFLEHKESTQLEQDHAEADAAIAGTVVVAGYAKDAPLLQGRGELQIHSFPSMVMKIGQNCVVRKV